MWKKDIWRFKMYQMSKKGFQWSSNSDCYSGSLCYIMRVNEDLFWNFFASESIHLYTGMFQWDNLIIVRLFITEILSNWGEYNVNV